MIIREIIQEELAKNEAQFSTLVNSGAEWIVRSKEDLRQVRREKPDGLARLTDEEFDSFLSAVKFAKNGIAGGNVRPLLTGRLNLREVLDVFHRFGMSTEYAMSIQESDCNEGECVWDFWSFCSHVTCHPRVVGPDES